MAYQTQPGTIPHRVIEWFKTQPVGTRKTLADIGEAIGYEGYPSELKIYLRAARYAGLIKHDGDGGPTDAWYLGDGAPIDRRTPAQRAADKQIGESELPVQRVVPADGASPQAVRIHGKAHALVPVAETGRYAVRAADGGKVAEAGSRLQAVARAALAVPPSEFDFCIRRNGTLELTGVEITVDGTVKITADQAREIRRLVAFL